MKVLFCLLLLSLYGNYLSSDGITYRELSWADFQGAVPQNEPSVAARTMTQIGMEISEETAGEEKRYYFRVKAYFLPDSSFVRARSDKNLRHEQTHFKIAYIASLRCMAALIRLQGCDSVGKVEADALFQAACRESSERNDQFDLETRHSNNLEAEKAWEVRISEELRIFETTSKKARGRN